MAKYTPTEAKQWAREHMVGSTNAPTTPFKADFSLDEVALAFNVDREVWPNPNLRWAELAYKLDVNEFRGQESVQLLVAHLEPR